MDTEFLHALHRQPASLKITRSGETRPCTLELSSGEEDDHQLYPRWRVALSPESVSFLVPSPLCDDVRGKRTGSDSRRAKRHRDGTN
ncbi:Hypothetical protein SMAX5B_017020 [Scophthalmus maximus]|uniref:Uncharacterized protein n=1 Tax=Scophthalmus maximus TaxID=52904 RepID=A0A2U9B9Q3_SCOMX|nr:Hypothetical protein SMAX5B_017020 [Scophthalmus maximus]